MPLESEALSCPKCGSNTINYERDALLIARVLALRGGMLELCEEPQSAALDSVQLACSSCGAELDLDWVETRPAGLDRHPGLPFRFDAFEAQRSIVDPDGAIWPVNSFSDADELNSLFETAVHSGIIASREQGALIHIYPLAISDPEPVLAVSPAKGPSILGCSLKLGERVGESPLEFTLRLLEETTIEANGLAESDALANVLGGASH